MQHPPSTLPLIYTIINEEVICLTQERFQLLNDRRSRRSIPLLQPLSQTEIEDYFAMEDAGTVPIFAEATDQDNQLLDNIPGSVFAVIIAVAVMLLGTVLLFLLYLYRAANLDVSAIFEWMGPHRAAMICIESLGALLWGILS